MRDESGTRFDFLLFIRRIVELGYWAALSGAGKGVLLVLIRRADQSSQSWASLKRISVEAGTNRRTAQPGIKDLIRVAIAKRKMIHYQTGKRKLILTLVIPSSPCQLQRHKIDLSGKTPLQRHKKCLSSEPSENQGDRTFKA